MLSQSGTFRQCYHYDQVKNTQNQINQTLAQSIQTQYTGNKRIKLKKDDQNSFYFKLRVIRKVARFIQNLKTAIILKEPALKPDQKFYLQNQYEQIEQEQSLISYQNPFRITFQILFSIVIIMILWKHSYEMAFCNLLFKNPIVQILTLLFIIINIIIFHNVEHKNQKLQKISNRKIILKHYLESRVAFDFLIIISLIIQISQIDSQIKILFIITRVLIFPLCTYVFQIWKKIKNIFVLSTQQESVFGIIKFLSQIFLVVHILAIIFIIISQYQKQNGINYTWVQSSGIETFSQFDIYILAWYWGCTIISTVGFGDLVPETMLQRIVVSFIQVFCCIAFGYFVSYIGALIGMLGQSKSGYQKDIRRLNLYLKHVLISNSLKNQIRSHFFNRYLIQQKYSSQQETKIREKFTDKIRQNIDEQNNKQILKSSKHIISLFSDQFITKLALSLVKRIYAPQDIVFDPSKFQNNQKVWILHQGQINQYLDRQFQTSKGTKTLKQSKPISKYQHKNKNTIGWLNFVSSQKYNTIAKANNFSVAYELNRQNFIKILYSETHDRNPNRLKFCEERQKILLNNEYYDKNCLACQKINHNSINCPRIHFNSNIKKKLEWNGGKGQIYLKQVRKNKYQRQRNRWKNIYDNVGETILDYMVRKSRNSYVYTNARKSIKQTEMLQHKRKNFSSMFNKTNSQKSGEVSPFFNGLMEQIILNKRGSQNQWKSLNSGRSHSVNDQLQIIRQQEGPKDMITEQLFDQILWDQQNFYFPENNQKSVLQKYNNKEINQRRTKKLRHHLLCTFLERNQQKQNGLLNKENDLSL